MNNDPWLKHKKDVCIGSGKPHIIKRSKLRYDFTSEFEDFEPLSEIELALYILQGEINPDELETETHIQPTSMED